MEGRDHRRSGEGQGRRPGSAGAGGAGGGDKTKTGVFLGSYARNPATGEAIPIWIADYVLMEYGTGAIMAVPAHDTRDFEFATQFKLPIREVVRTGGGEPLPSVTEDGVLVNSGEFDGLSCRE